MGIKLYRGSSIGSLDLMRLQLRFPFQRRNVGCPKNIDDMTTAGKEVELALSVVAHDDDIGRHVNIHRLIIRFM